MEQNRKSKSKCTNVWTTDFDKDAKVSFSVEKRRSFQKILLKLLHIRNPKSELQPTPTLLIKITSKWTINKNVKPKYKTSRRKHRKKTFVTLG